MMKADCQWISTNLEAYFCDRLTAEETRLVQNHIETCQDCHTQVEGIREIDPLIKRYFQHQLAIARSPRRRQFAWAYAGAAAALAIAIILGITLRRPEAETDLNPPPSGVPTATSPATQPEIKKATQTTGTERAKPRDAAGSTATPPIPAVAPWPGTDQPDFTVTDLAGYSRTLGDYRGYVLLVGVLSPDQPQAIANMERLYQSFGAQTQIRVLGVSNERQAKPPNTTFPMAYNQGSRLLGAATSEFVLVDQSGVVRLRGSLLKESSELVREIRGQVTNFF